MCRGVYWLCRLLFEVPYILQLVEVFSPHCESTRASPALSRSVHQSPPLQMQARWSMQCFSAPSKPDFRASLVGLRRYGSTDSAHVSRADEDHEFVVAPLLHGACHRVTPFTAVATYSGGECHLTACSFCLTACISVRMPAL